MDKRAIPCLPLEGVWSIRVGSVFEACLPDNSGNHMPLITGNSGIASSGFSASASCSFGGGGYCSTTVYAAPPNVYAVVQSVSGTCFMSTTAYPQALTYDDLYVNAHRPLHAIAHTHPARRCPLRSHS